MIGEKIREYRERRGYSIEELGKLCGFGKDAKRIIADFEEDKGFPDIEKLKNVAEVLSVPLEVLCLVACRNVLLRQRKRLLFIWKTTLDMKLKTENTKTQKMKVFCMTIWIFNFKFSYYRNWYSCYCINCKYIFKCI